MDIEGNRAIEFRGPGRGGGTEAQLWIVMTIFV
jgi:hypothetical protein